MSRRVPMIFTETSVYSIHPIKEASIYHSFCQLENVLWAPILTCCTAAPSLPQMEFQ